MPGTAGQPAGDANANVEDPAQKPVPPDVPNPQPPLDPPHRGESEPGDTRALDARGIAQARRAPADATTPDPRGEPGVAEAAEAEAEAARKQRQEELRAEADALDDTAEEAVDLNEDAGAPLDANPEETEPESVPKKGKASK